MDDRRFDDLTRRLAQSVSRRAAMKGGVAALLGAVGLRGNAAAQVMQRDCGNVICASDPGKCKPGCVCCVYTNPVTGRVINSRCRPPGQCSSGTEVVPTTPPPTTPAPTTPPPTTTTTAAPPTTTPVPTTEPPTTSTTSTTTTTAPTTTTASPTTTTTAPTTTTTTVAPTTTAPPPTSTTAAPTTTATPTTTTTAPPDDGLACTHLVCDGDGCRHVLQPAFCLIEGACYVAGTLNPEDTCRRCDPAQDQRRWSRVLDGAPCGDGACISGATCISGFCSGGEASTDGCAIAGVCYPAGATRPSNTCFVCDPARSKVQWSLNDNGTPCTGLCRADGTCQFGICTGGTVSGGFCHIDDVCVPAGETRPGFGPCWVCDPARNAEFWSRLDDDTPCTNFCVANPTCQAGICTGEEPVVCEQPPDREFCQRSVCDPASGTCVMQPIPNLRQDTKGCEFCRLCVDGACLFPTEPVDCGLCGTCDEGTGTCAPKPAGGDCGSDCTTRRTCDGGGACVEELGLCGLNIGCEARVCDPETQQCVETGAHDGQPCGGVPCRECRDGTCQPKQCRGDCDSCDPTSGQCVACEPCCKGACGMQTCGPTCCPPNTVCIVTNGDTFSCCPSDRYCEGKCFPSAISCCGKDILGQVVTCGADEMCCTTDAFRCCDAVSEICGVFGCVTRN